MIVEDRFYDPIGHRSINEMTEEAYEKYLVEMEDQDGNPMSYDDFEDWYWRF